MGASAGAVSSRAIDLTWLRARAGAAAIPCENVSLVLENGQLGRVCPVLALARTDGVSFGVLGVNR